MRFMVKLKFCRCEPGWFPEKDFTTVNGHEVHIVGDNRHFTNTCDSIGGSIPDGPVPAVEPIMFAYKWILGDLIPDNPGSNFSGPTPLEETPDLNVFPSMLGKKPLDIANAVYKVDNILNSDMPLTNQVARALCVVVLGKDENDLRRMAQSGQEIKILLNQHMTRYSIHLSDTNLDVLQSFLGSSNLWDR